MGLFNSIYCRTPGIIWDMLVYWKIEVSPWKKERLTLFSRGQNTLSCHAGFWCLDSWMCKSAELNEYRFVARWGSQAYSYKPSNQCHSGALGESVINEGFVNMSAVGCRVQCAGSNVSASKTLRLPCPSKTFSMLPFLFLHFLILLCRYIYLHVGFISDHIS